MAGTFSDSWYRVAKVRLTLRPNVTFRRQRYQGEDWYVMSDPYTGSYFRLSPTYYDFVSRLSFEDTVEDIWVKAMEANPETAPGQQEIITLISELYRESLIYFKDANDSVRLYERHWKKEREKTRKQIMNFLFVKIPLGNPNRLLNEFMGLWRWIFSYGGLVLWLGVILLGAKTALENGEALVSGAGAVLAPDNLILLYLALAILKILHEWGHAALCKRFGGDVTLWGVMFVLFTPLPFVDTTSAWVMREKIQRILVSCGGMIVELFIGALACMVWAATPPGFIHALAYNMMFTATVSTVLFNANPLMRFDGYYILSDAIEIPNLQSKGKNQVYNLCQRYLFGLKTAQSTASSRKEAYWLTTYGFAAAVYRVVLLVGIILFIADSYFFLGIALAVVMGTVWLVVPVVKFILYLHSNSQLRRVRMRALGVVYGTVAAVIGGLFFVPLPRSVEAVGLVQAEQQQDLLAQSSAQVAAILQAPNTFVQAGTPLIALHNPYIPLELAKVRQQLKQNDIMMQQVISQQGIDREPVLKNKESLLALQDQVLDKQNSLLVRAPFDGIWFFDQGDVIVGQWIQQGANLGRVMHAGQSRFVGVIAQEQASDLFDFSFDQAEIRLKGQEHITLSGQRVTLLPHAQNILPSAALGWAAGGPIAVDKSDQEGRKTQEPFYQIEAHIMGEFEAALGQTGIMKVALASEPLGIQLVRFVRQFLQQRYQL